MTMSADKRIGISLGMLSGTANGKHIGRYEAFGEVERLAMQLRASMARYEDPRQIDQIIAHCRHAKELELRATQQTG